MPARTLIPFTIPLLLLTACSSDDDSPGCPGIAFAGISLTVTDATTGARLCGATVEFRDGDHVETPFQNGPDDQCTYVGAYERAGTYTVTATVAGYASASQQVTVTSQSGQCPHVNTEQVTLSLGK